MQNFLGTIIKFQIDRNVSTTTQTKCESEKIIMESIIEFYLNMDVKVKKKKTHLKTITFHLR